MRNVYIHDSAAVIADSPEGFVEQLRATCFFPERDIQQYMDAVSLRCKVQAGVDIRVSSASVFVCDLHKYGFINIINIS